MTLKYDVSNDASNDASNDVSNDVIVQLVCLYIPEFFSIIFIDRSWITTKYRTMDSVKPSMIWLFKMSKFGYINSQNFALESAPKAFNLYNNSSRGNNHDLPVISEKRRKEVLATQPNNTTTPKDREIEALKRLHKITFKDKHPRRQRVRKRLLTWPIVTLKPRRSQNVRKATHNQTYHEKQRNRTNSKVDRMVRTAEKKKQPRCTTRTVPEVNELSKDVTEELWWKDIHEPIDNIVKIIQKQFHALEVKEDNYFNM